MRLIANSLILFTLFTTKACFSLASDNNLPYKISSDALVYSRKLNETTYTGHVIAKQGTRVITGDKLIVKNDPITHRIIELIAIGKLAKYSVLLDNKKNKLHAQAEIIKYWPIKGKAQLIHRAKVTQKNNIFKGKKIWYDIKNQTVFTKPSGKQRSTTIIIEPNQKK
jgi:lipopolysaccharide export system protein LptA